MDVVNQVGGMNGEIDTEINAGAGVQLNDSVVRINLYKFENGKYKQIQIIVDYVKKISMANTLKECSFLCYQLQIESYPDFDPIVDDIFMPNG